jgi:parallel beta-helix repeat protein
MRRDFALIIAGAIALLALTVGRLRDWRPISLGSLATHEFIVTSPRDGGPGSLREAIFAADRKQGHARIVLRTPRVELRTPLPPLVNASGIELDAEDSGCEIEAGRIGLEPVLDVDAPDSEIHAVAIRNAGGTGIRVRERRTLLKGVRVRNSSTGVEAAAGSEGLRIEKSDFSANDTGVRISHESASAVLVSSRFQGHGRAAVWAVSPDQAGSAGGASLIVRDNEFTNDRISVVLINMPGELVNNRMLGAKEVSLYLMGGAGVVRKNRIQSGAGVGVFADESQGIIIEGNEVDRNRFVGMILRGGRNSLVRGNRVYLNGYGIATVFGEAGHPHVVSENLILSQGYDGLYVVGGSPILRNNRVLKNKAAGVRILDFVSRRRAPISAHPLLSGNELEQNLLNEPVRGTYEEPVANDRR